MDSFRWIAVALSMILGLAVTRLLSALIAVFRSRSHSKLDWLPLAWAGCIFLWQIQFWWAIVELPEKVKAWTPAGFLTLLGLPLLLFVSAALILPPNELGKHESLRDSFERDGRWALASLSLYLVLALFVDWLFWHISPLSRWGALLATLTILSLACAWTRLRRVQEVVTLVYVPLSLWAAWMLSPGSYD